MSGSRRRVALVTGASRGIGRGICLELTRGGFDIAGNATSYDPKNLSEGLAEVGARVAELGGAFLPLPADIARLDTHAGVIDTVYDRFGALDLLVNNAGIAPDPRRDILETTPESFDRVLAVNTRAAFFLSQHVARRMIATADIGAARAHRAIIFISSISAYASSPERAEYCISKAAISHAAGIFAERLAECGIQVFEIRPGIIRTDMTASVAAQYDERIAAGLVPQGRWGEPEDVGRAVRSLARGDFAYSTGLVVEVSGGMNIRRL